MICSQICLRLNEFQILFKFSIAIKEQFFVLYKVRSKVNRTFKKKTEQMVLSAKSINFIQNT